MVVRLGRRLAVESGFASGEKTFQAYMVKGFVCVLICSDGRLYIGSTRNLDNRIEHIVMEELKLQRAVDQLF